MQATSLELFPTRIWVFDLPELLAHHGVWIDAIHAMRASESTPAGRSNRSGWNSAKTVFGNQLFVPLREAAKAAFIHAFQQMALQNDLTFQLEAWVNLHDPGGFNTAHVHPNCLLSACYYIDVPDGAGPIVFRDPRPGPVLIEFDGKGANCRTAEALYPKAGQLIAFPHWLEHFVEPNQGQTARISVAMNGILPRAAK